MTLAADLLAEGQPAGGGSWLLPLMLVAMVLLLWLPMRRQKKAQAQMKEKQATMEPGTKVMTSFGLFGTLVTIDREQNKAVLEIAPGMPVTVHSQTVTTVVDEEQPAVGSGEAAAGDATDAGAAGSHTARTRTEGITTEGDGTGTTSGDVPQDGTGDTHRTWRDARGDDPTA